ncbi:hypothetical protein MTR67_005300 [Solanum verrucosum]|uniref:Uncharacterized protein n=1 Tax=Solanum verrucosum TaxID=315347 RepID=A0AAF0PXU2_SOLVR|nr:hypothetical protein MTR67_005300 [Solanum verrucosum]
MHYLSLIPRLKKLYASMRWHPAKDAAWTLKNCVKRLIHRLITIEVRFQTVYTRRCLMNLRLCVLGSRGQLQSSLEGIGSSRQIETLDGVQITAMSAQIAHLTSALIESERRREAEQRSMSAIVQQIKEQVLNLARRPTTSAPKDTNDSEDEEDDYVDLTP